MKTPFSFLAFALVSTSLNIFAHPLNAKRQQIDDITILNFALTLEHLEDAFYTEGLKRFSQNDFLAAGLPHFSRGRFEEVAKHERKHVEYLTQALGDKATKPCQYSFPYNDPRSFTALSQVLEGVGTSAYSGAAKLITNKDYLTVAAVVLSTEARHAAWVASAVNKFAAWSGDFDTPLSPSTVFSLAVPFITSCPSSNPNLGIQPFPALSIVTTTPKPGEPIELSFNPGSSASGSQHAVFYSGLDTFFVPLESGNKVVVPAQLRGMVYVVVNNGGEDVGVKDDTVVAGVGVIRIETNSRGEVIN